MGPVGRWVVGMGPVGRMGVDSQGRTGQATGAEAMERQREQLGSECGWGHQRQDH